MSENNTNSFHDIQDDARKAVEELRQRMKGDMEPELYDDIYMFLRFLKARDFNINNAEDMLRKHLEWRGKKDIKNIFKYKKPEVAAKYAPNVFLGYDKEGCVVRYSPVGNIDVIGIHYCLKSEEILKLWIYETEIDKRNLKQHSKEIGRHVEKCIYIYDMENLTFAKVTDKRVVYNAINIAIFYQNNYPEMMKMLLCINSSIYATMLYNMLKKFLANSVANKIRFYSDDSYKEDLLKMVDADVLPAFLGGTKTDPDGNPRCRSLILPGGPIPEKYYMHKSKRSIANQSGAKRIILPKASYHEELLIVKEPGSYLEWEFETKCRDIGFGVFYEYDEDSSNMIELIPWQRIDTEEYAETGTCMCKNTGKYVFLFDNTYSWIRSKEIYYRVKVVSPEEHKSEIDKR